MNTLKIGKFIIENPVVLAPMAGITDVSFRKLCHSMGAGMTVSEMITSNTKLWSSTKTKIRMNHSGEISPRSVQIAGGDPQMMKEAAIRSVDLGAEIIDINMGCPAKKVCNKLAGSALLKDELLVYKILNEVTSAVSVPITLKIRTGWSPQHKNGVRISKIAENAGIAALAVHGRTRDCMFNGLAEYETIAQICETVSIPVIANGDISSPEKALQVLNYTGAQAVMIGRAAQGNPWIFKEINHYLKYGKILETPRPNEIKKVLLIHMADLYQLYGKNVGVRICRKHVGWYLQNANTRDNQVFRKYFNRLLEPNTQLEAINMYFDQLVNDKNICV